MAVTTNTTKLRATIFPLRNISPSTHTYGFLSSIHPLDSAGFAIPQNDLVLNVAKDKGYRYYSYIKDIEIFDILGALKEQIAKLTSTLSIETCYFQVSKINLMSLDNVLLPSDFDGDNITDFNSVNVLSDINFQYQNVETTDSEYIKYSGLLKDETRDAKIRVTFTNGANSTSYDVYFSTIVVAATTSTYWVDVRDELDPLFPGYYETQTIPAQTITHDLVAGGTYVMLADDLNFLKTLENSLPSLLNMKTGATIYSEKNILRKQKVTFTFKTPLKDLTAGTDLGSLSQFMTRYGFERFGVGIHESGATTTAELNALAPFDNYAAVLGINDATMLTYGICNYLSHSLEENTITWSGYYYRLPRSPELFNLVKIGNRAPDSTCILGVGFENFLGSSVKVTCVRDTTNDEDDVVFLAGCTAGSGNVDVLYTKNWGLQNELAAPNPPSTKIHMYYEFEIKNLTKTGTALAEINCTVRFTNPTLTLLNVVSINKNGVYRFVASIDYDSANDLFVDFILDPKTIVPAASTITFSVTNVYYGECV